MESAVYDIAQVRKRLYNTDSQLVSYALYHSPEVFDALLLRSPQRANVMPRTPSGTLFSSTKRALSSAVQQKQSCITHKYYFRPVQLVDFNKNDVVRVSVGNDVQAWHGKEEFTARIRKSVRDQFYQVEYNKQIQRCAEKCYARADSEQEQRTKKIGTLHGNVLALQDTTGKIELESEKLYVKIENALKSNAYLRLRLESEKRYLAALKQSESVFLTNLPHLAYIHERFAYMDAEMISARISALESSIIKAYIRLGETDAEMQTTCGTAEDVLSKYYEEQQKQEELSRHAKRKLEYQALKLYVEQTRLDEDSNQAARAQTLLATVTGVVSQFVADWSVSLLLLIDARYLEYLKKQPYYEYMYQRTKDPLEALYTLSNIADFVVGYHPGVDASRQSLTVKKTALGAVYRKIALYCEQIHKTLYYRDGGIAKDVVAIVERVCTGAVDGELTKQHKMQDIQVLEQDIIKLVQVRDEMEKWQLYVVEQLEHLICRKEKGVE